MIIAYWGLLGLGATLLFARPVQAGEGWGVFDQETGVPHQYGSPAKPTDARCEQARGVVVEGIVRDQCFKGCDARQGVNAYGRPLVWLTGAGCGLDRHPPRAVAPVPPREATKPAQPRHPLAWIQREQCWLYERFVFVTSERGTCLGPCSVDVSAEGKLFRLTMNGRTCPAYGHAILPRDALRVDEWSRRRFAALLQPPKPAASTTASAPKTEEKKNATPTGPGSIFFPGK